jgi:predicted ATPase
LVQRDERLEHLDLSVELLQGPTQVVPGHLRAHKSSSQQSESANVQARTRGKAH